MLPNLNLVHYIGSFPDNTERMTYQHSNTKTTSTISKQFFTKSQRAKEIFRSNFYDSLRHCSLDEFNKLFADLSRHWNAKERLYFTKYIQQDLLKQRTKNTTLSLMTRTTTSGKVAMLMLTNFFQMNFARQVIER